MPADSKTVDAYVGLRVDWVRHGIAELRHPDQTDAARSLTEAGQKRTRQVARRLKALGWHWQVILSSPLLRAEQTATVLLQEGLADQMQDFPALAPGGDFAQLVQWHQQNPQIQSLAVVGHQPDLSEWITQAVWGELGSAAANREPIVFKKAGIARVEFPAGKVEVGEGLLSLLLSPKLLMQD
jgi:phosphohistidine phosphatase